MKTRVMGSELNDAQTLSIVNVEAAIQRDP